MYIRKPTMKKEKILTIRMNYLLTLGLGMLFLMYVIFAFSTSLWQDRIGMIILSIFGVVYWIIIEGHTAMRFAWLKENSIDYILIKQAAAHPLNLIRKAYNAAFWIFLLPFFAIIDYKTGFIVFTINIFVRLSANLYVNIRNFEPEQFDKFPLRIS